MREISSRQSICHSSNPGAVVLDGRPDFSDRQIWIVLGFAWFVYGVAAGMFVYIVANLWGSL